MLPGSNPPGPTSPCESNSVVASQHADLALSESTAPAPVSHDPSQRHLWTPSGPIEPSREQPPIARLSKHATHLFSVSYLIFFAIFGTLARIGLQALTIYPGAPVITGLLMGFFLEDRNVFREEWGGDCKRDEDTTEHERAKTHKSVKKTIPLYIGLTTGFCGCFTSFSTFARDIFLALSNDLSSPPPSAPIVSRNGGYSFMALVAVILLTVSLSLSSLIFGAHLALALHPLTPTIPFTLTRSPGSAVRPPRLGLLARRRLHGHLAARSLLRH
ncbi:chromosome condensation protein [Aspergillus sp. HF37]|nr:chromosome condensation protein [Aspergillus sp. HF37]